MNTVARVVIVGQVESRERKKVGEGDKAKNLCEFRVEGVGLKLSAWQDLAVKVPEKGLVLVEGRLNTRSYTYEGKDRESTEIVVSSIELVDAGDSGDLPF